MTKAEAPVASPLLDYMGREITVGCTVVYPVRRGSLMWLSRIVVTQIVNGPSPSLKGFKPNGRPVPIQNIGNVAVVEPVKPAEAI